jgi:hypothetical protein
MAIASMLLFSGQTNSEEQKRRLPEVVAVVKAGPDGFPKFMAESRSSLKAM